MAITYLAKPCQKKNVSYIDLASLAMATHKRGGHFRRSTYLKVHDNINMAVKGELMIRDKTK